MARGFAERLDRVMEITRTTNSALARALSFDPSYICRIRNGKRGLPVNQPFIDPLVAYLAKRVTKDHQKRALSEELGRPWPEDPEQAEALLAGWLLSATENELAIKRMVDALEAPPKNIPDTNVTRAVQGDLSQARFFYGNEGKRDAVISFLSSLCDTGEPHTLLLHSDEDMTWLYEDEAFAQQWAALLFKLAKNGGRVRIVHAISRDANELWEAAQKWIPFYMTGAVEPYYYPLLRDGVYRRTLFVAPKHSALISTSVAGGATNGLNMLVEDSRAVDALAGEFADYFELCRPLMHVSFPQNPSETAQAIEDFAAGGQNALASLDGHKLICAQEDGHALLANVGASPVIFEVSEGRMAGTIWSYLRNLPKGDVSQGAEAQSLLDKLLTSLRQEDGAS